MEVVGRVILVLDPAEDVQGALVTLLLDVRAVELLDEGGRVDEVFRMLVELVELVLAELVDEIMVDELGVFEILVESVESVDGTFDSVDGVLVMSFGTIVESSEVLVESTNEVIVELGIDIDVASTTENDKVCVGLKLGDPLIESVRVPEVLSGPPC